MIERIRVDEFETGYKRLCGAHGKNASSAHLVAQAVVWYGELKTSIDAAEWSRIVNHFVKAEKFPTLADVLTHVPKPTADDRASKVAYVNSDCVVVGCIDGIIPVADARGVETTFRCTVCSRYKASPRMLPYREDLQGFLPRRTEAQMRERYDERYAIEFLGKTAMQFVQDRIKATAERMSA